MTTDDILKATTPNALNAASNDDLDNLYNIASGLLREEDAGVARQIQNSIQAIHAERLHRTSKKIEDRLTELKKPHRLVSLTFWVAFAAAIIALGAWLFPRAPDVQKEDTKSVSVPALVAPISQPVRTEASVPVAIPQNPKVFPVATPATKPKQ
jgi:cytoskeletal protein RodZ